MTISEHSQPKLFEETELPLTQSAAVSHAKMLASLESALVLMAREVGSGANTRDWFASYDRALSSWRTHQACLVSGWAEFSETWPRSGMIVSGIAYQLSQSVLRMSAIGSGLLPMPRKNDAEKRGDFDAHNPRHGLPAAVKRAFWPTMGKNEFKGAAKKRHRGSVHFRGAKMSEGLRSLETDPIYLHPSFAEIVMGYPIGWTELEPSETP